MMAFGIKFKFGWAYDCKIHLYPQTSSVNSKSSFCGKAYITLLRFSNFSFPYQQNILMKFKHCVVAKAEKTREMKYVSN